MILQAAPLSRSVFARPPQLEGRGRAPARRPRHTAARTVCASATLPDGAAGERGDSTSDFPKVRRLSLPTTRERKYLKMIGVQRNHGRPMLTTRTLGFTLSVWKMSIQSRREVWVPGAGDATSTAFTTSVDSTSDDDDSGFVVASTEDDEGEDADDTSTEDGDNDDDELAGTDDQKKVYIETPQKLPPWAYICYIHASKATIGKRAVQRNRAQRRMRAAAALVLPQHAVRGMEYRFSLNPEILVLPLETIVDDVHSSLKAARCHSTTLTIDMLRREQYCKR